MKIEKKIALVLSRKSNDELKKYKFIGAEIKSSRLKMSKTLDAIDNVNKSISYISKIENNKIIPNEKCLQELCDELLIPQKDLESMSKFDDCILDAIEAIYMLDYEKMNSLYEIYSTFKNTRTNLMKGLYYYLFDKQEELENVVENLSLIENSLSIDDYLVYVLLCVKNFLLQKNNIQAYKVVKVVLESNTTKDDLLCIFRLLELEIKLAFRINAFTNDYYEIIKMHIENENILRVKQLIDVYSIVKAELLGKNLHISNISKISNVDIMFYSYCLSNNIEKATLIYNDEITPSYKLYYFYITKNIDMINQMINNTMTEENMIIANCYKLELESNYELYRNYLINICIPYFKKISKINSLLYFYDILVDLNTKVAKYKDSGIIGKEICLLIRETTTLTS